ncbi:MAG: GIY-YIG nuclease family protein [Pseudomonadota bacterium]
MGVTNWVYILASDRNGTLYVGSTSELGLRLEEHRSGQGSKFVRKYGVYTLVYFEIAASKEDALHREHQLKRWRRKWKLDLIEADNPTWADLTEVARKAVAREW